MKIRLLCDLPCSDDYGARKGREFKVIEERPAIYSGAKKGYLFLADNGDEFIAFDFEVEVIEEGGE